MKKLVLNTLAISVLMGSSISIVKAESLVGVTIYQYDDTFMNLMKDEISNQASALKDVKFLMNDSQNSQAVQNNQIDILLAKKVKVLAVNLVHTAAATTLIEKAKQQQVPIIFFNKDPGEKILSSYDKAYYIGSSAKSSAIEQAHLIAKHWNKYPELDLNKDGKIQYALLKGEPESTAAITRSQYVIEELHNLGLKTQPVFSDTAMWNSDMAKDRMDLWLNDTQGNNIEVIISNNDAMAIGALASLQEHHKKLPIFSVDALPRALRFVKSGDITGTVLNDGVTQSRVLVKLAHDLALGKPMNKNADWALENNSIRTPDIAIDQDNIDKFLK